MKHAILLGLLAMTTFTQAIHSADNANLSHAERDTLEGAIHSIANKIKQRGDLPYITVARQLELLEGLTQFELGRFLIQRGGLNGYWTHYVNTHPKQGRLTGLNSENKPFNEVESFLLNKAPTALAMQQRVEIFQREIQKLLFNGISLASIPCGLTIDLMDLDFSQISQFSICGIDIDPESLTQSQQIANHLGMTDHCQFLQRDAWALNCDSKFDLITSNGLSIYETDDQKIVELYRQFFISLKPNGCLITSFLTPPPIPGTQTQWDLKAVNSEDALLQKIIISDILAGKWQAYRSEELVKSQLQEAGFTEIEIYYDQAHIFPTVVAKKEPKHE